ncbi:MAG: tetratricopeptide repeat protein [Bacteroidaceae bacterium]|nr:tetratricopeptide repeat protein [Bacteroidaceae bacterium]
MFKKICLLLTLVAAVFLGSCSSKMKSLKPEYFTVTPGVLEVVGSEVPVVVDGKFPAKFFKKKAVLTITPVLKYNGGEALAEPMTFQGEKVRGNDRVVSYDNGGTFRMKMAFDYVPGMEDAELYMRFVVNKGSKVYTLPDVKVADGCIATSQLYRQAAATANIAVGEDAFQRVIKQAKEANIMFLIQQANLRASELNSADMKELKASIVDVATDYENKILEDIQISAYASPDGKMDLNYDISTSREANTAKYMKNELKKAKLEGYVDSEYTAEDWEGFSELVANSNLPDKELILRVLSMYEDPEEREQQIKNISSVYSDLADEILPKLRRARITLNYQLIGRSDEQIVAQYAEDPKVLSLEEILYSSILTEDPAKQEEIFNTAIKLHPGDYRAYNNLGVMAYKRGDYNTAAEYFAKAANANSSAPEVKLNMGYLELLEGNVAAADSYITLGVDAKAGNEALGNLYIAQGDYARAAALLEDANTNSAALAQLLNTNYSAARKTIEKIENPDATTHYIKAVLGARTQNVAFLYDGLKEAIKLDPSLAKKAASDLEFVKYLGDATFQNIVK